MATRADFFRTDHLMRDLKGRSMRGGAFTVATQGIRFLIQTVSTMLLGRLLLPHDFGLVGMVTGVTGFVGMFKDAGLSLATVQREKITHEQVSTLFWINVAMSVGLMLLIAALSPAIAWFYGEPRLTAIALAIACTFLFGGLTIQHQALLQRQMRFRDLGIIQVISMASGVPVGVSVAWLTHSYWALVAMPATSAVVNAAAVWVACRWIPGLPRRGSGVRPMLNFGGNMTASGLVNYLARNVDNVLVGWWWGAAPLGFYSKAYGLLLLPLRQINAPLSATMIPALSRLRSEPERLRRAFSMALRIICLATMPMMAMMVAGSDTLIWIALGPSWGDAAPIFAWLGIAGLVQPANSALGALLVSQDRSRDYFWAGTATGVITVIGFLVTVPMGVKAVAIGYAVTTLLTTPGMWLWVGRRGCVSTMDIATTVAYPFGVACAGLAVSLVVARFYHSTMVVEDCVSVGSGLVAMGAIVLATKTGRGIVREIQNCVALLRPGTKRVGLAERA